MIGYSAPEIILPVAPPMPQGGERPANCRMTLTVGGHQMGLEAIPPASRIEDDDEFLRRYLPGVSPDVVRLRATIMRLNSSRNRHLIRVITILGESGAGKSYLARVIAAHANWIELAGRGEDLGIEAGLKSYLQKYIEIALPALPDTLIESELFGYKKGAFTGAGKNTPGLLGGEGERDPYKHILLDEIGDASPLLQAKILTVVEHGKFMPVGGRAGDECMTDARLILATNRNIEALMREGKFREDLFWRIRDYIVRVPPLRKQPENIEGIIREIEMEMLRERGVDLTKKKGEDLSKKKLAGMEAEIELHIGGSDIEWAQSYQWEGNIRELRHAVVRWHFEDGKVSLKEIVERIHEEVNSNERISVVGNTVDEIVRERLAGVGKGDRTPPGTLGDLVKEFDRQVEAAVVRWYEETQPDPETLLGIFSRQKNIDSIRNKISQWKRQQGNQ